MLGSVPDADGPNDFDDFCQTHHDEDSDDHLPPLLPIFQDGAEGCCDASPAGVLMGVSEALPQKPVVISISQFERVAVREPLTVFAGAYHGLILIIESKR